MYKTNTKIIKPKETLDKSSIEFKREDIKQEIEGIYGGIRQK